MPTGVQKYMIIDGQQRMTTLTLLLLALRDYAIKNPEDNTINCKRIDNMLLKNEYESGDDRYKLLLTETDRDILMGLEPNEQNYVYDHLWRPMELLFEYETQGSVMHRFFRDYLTMKITRIPKQDRVYEEFKTYHLNYEFATIRELCQDIYTYAKYYTDMVFRRSSNPALKSLYEDINDLRMEVSYPFLFRVHNDCEDGLIKIDELSEIIRLCISYVFRRSICDIPTNSLTRINRKSLFYIFPLCVILKKKGGPSCYLQINTPIRFMVSLPVIIA